MSRQDPNDRRLDHVVVLMFENRSFDNLLGYLYEPGEVARFEGVVGRDLANPIPRDLTGGTESSVSVHPATSLATPYPDPGEEYSHVNTQLFASVDPPSNRFAAIDDLEPPYNAPVAPSVPAMSGFVQDYVNAFRGQMDRMPRPAEYSQIMASYTRAQVPVLSGLARGFACFDHWFCEVPSQTYANRSFFHAASSNGYVLNGHPPGKFARHNSGTTLFNLLEEAERTWAVYIDPRQLVPATGLLHATRLWPFFPTHFRTIFDFLAEAREGRLPNYAFIEPNMFHPHTDMHPHSGARWTEDLRIPPPDTLIGGERLLSDVYAVVRSSASDDGSNWANTALIVTFDEHGGTFDHVPPPRAEPVPAPELEQGFRFDRLGVRIPTVIVSAWAEERTVVTDTFRSTSVIRTLRDWWGLGGPLTPRDASAPSFLSVLSRSTARPVLSWPQVSPSTSGLAERLEDRFLQLTEMLEAPMERLERDLLGDALAHESARSGAPVQADSEQVSHKEAHEHFRRIGTRYFPGIASGRQH